jgi:hypothetical protein
MKHLTIAIVCAVSLVLAGCSGAPGPAVKKAEEKPPEPVSGRDALYKMFMAARSWAGDVEILRLNSIHLPDVPYVPGKAAAWQVNFVSSSKGRQRGWTYSVVQGEGNLHKGLFAGLEQSWSGPRGAIRPMIIQAVQTDSDAAYEAAIGRAAAYEKKNPGKTISVVLEATGRHPNPTWRIVWGDSVASSDFSILVDASTGLYVETLR